MVSRYGFGRESRMFQMGVDAFQLNHHGGKGVLPKLLCNRNLLLCLKLRGRVGLRRILTHSPICSDSYLYRIPFQTGQPDKYNFRSHDHMRLLQDKNMNCYSSLHKILQDILFIEKKGKNSFSSHLILKT